jgi:hypothetical protein
MVLPVTMALLRTFTTSVLVMLSFAACDVGEVPIGGGGGDGGGGGPDAGGTTTGFATTCIDRATTIGTAHQHSGVAVNPTHAGEGCLNVGCHGPAQPGGEYAAGGTVYKTDGTTPNAGAVVRIKNGTGVLTMVADDAGTFHAGPTTIMYPTITDVSACPSSSKMTTKLTAAGGPNCSQSGCHTTAGGQGPIRGLN